MPRALPLPSPRKEEDDKGDASSDDSDMHVKAQVIRESFGDDEDREISRVVKRKEPKRSNPLSPMVPKVRLMPYLGY